MISARRTPMLVRTLTGVETDRIKEEKERGIAIERGDCIWPAARRCAPVTHAINTQPFVFRS